MSCSYLWFDALTTRTVRLQRVWVFNWLKYHNAVLISRVWGSIAKTVVCGLRTQRSDHGEEKMGHYTLLLSVKREDKSIKKPEEYDHWIPMSSCSWARTINWRGFSLLHPSHSFSPPKVKELIEAEREPCSYFSHGPYLARRHWSLVNCCPQDSTCIKTSMSPADPIIWAGQCPNFWHDFVSVAMLRLRPSLHMSWVESA